MTEWTPGGRSARQALLGALERGEAIGATAESAAVMRAALRDVWALAQRWRAGCSDVGPAAAAEVCDAICGDLEPGLPRLRELDQGRLIQPGTCTCGAAERNRQRSPGGRNEIHAAGCPAAVPAVDRERWRSNLPQQPVQAAEEDQPWRSGGEVPGG